MRLLTIPEVRRLQTFPDDWSLVGDEDSQLRQLGNAVPPTLAKALMGAVADALRD
jgi:DNA (cytosine-5)-methyltransferase 1